MESKKYWTEKLRNETPSDWPHKQEGPKKFTEAEKKKLLNALSKLPGELKTSTIKGIYRMTKSKDFPNPASHGGSMIVLYDIAFTSNKLDRILVHEMAHETYDKLAESKKDDYKTATNWFQGKTLQGKEFTIRRDSGFVKEDGLISPEEDFANNVEFYLYETSRLKSTTPNAYQWIAKHFGDNFKLRSACAY